MPLSELPPLDAHAHIAADVRADQIHGLGNALVAMESTTSILQSCLIH